MFDSKPLLQMCSICKDFYGNKVLEGIDFHLKLSGGKRSWKINPHERSVWNACYP